MKEIILNPLFQLKPVEPSLSYSNQFVHLHPTKHGYGVLVDNVCTIPLPSICLKQLPQTYYSRSHSSLHVPCLTTTSVSIYTPQNIAMESSLILYSLSVSLVFASDSCLRHNTRRKLFLITHQLNKQKLFSCIQNRGIFLHELKNKAVLCVI